MENNITIKLGKSKGYVSADALIEALESTLKILRGVARSINPSRPIRWEVVHASTKSPLTIKLAPKAIEPRYMKSAARSGGRILKETNKGFRLISKDAEIPRFFDDEALSGAKELGELAMREQIPLEIHTPNEDPIIATPELVENVKQAVSKTKTLYEEGVIEGRLEVISTHERDSFIVWEVLTGIKVECFPTSQEQFAKLPAFLRKRVAVHGKIKCRIDKPVSVQVDEVQPLRDQHELPQPKDIGKVDITGGLDSDEYVRRLRNGDG